VASPGRQAVKLSIVLMHFRDEIGENRAVERETSESNVANVAVRILSPVVVPHERAVEDISNILIRLQEVCDMCVN
jgi:hypothetical protein